jgi:hypothetical protein
MIPFTTFHSRTGFPSWFVLHFTGSLSEPGRCIPSHPIRHFAAYIYSRSTAIRGYPQTTSGRFDSGCYKHATAELRLRSQRFGTFEMVFLVVLEDIATPYQHWRTASLLSGCNKNSPYEGGRDASLLQEVPVQPHPGEEARLPVKHHLLLVDLHWILQSTQATQVTCAPSGVRYAVVSAKLK